jgi:hypothetical protein
MGGLQFFNQDHKDLSSEVDGRCVVTVPLCIAPDLQSCKSKMSNIDSKILKISNDVELIRLNAFSASQFKINPCFTQMLKPY